MMFIPTVMSAIEINHPGDPDVLQLVQRPCPQPADNEVLIHVMAAGINRPDLLQRRGLYAPPPGASDLPGLEVAGVIVAIGSQVTRYRKGDKVCALLPGGGYAEYCTVDERHALPIPATLNFVEAAALPETFFTVWVNVFQRGKLQAGETLLVHGGTSGIGSVTIMLAKAWGARVIATAGSAEKCDACLALGADYAINYREEDFVDAVNNITQGKGADVIVDIIGGDYLAKNLQAAAMDGRIVQIGIQNGHTAHLDLRALLYKRLTLTGSTLRARHPDDKAQLASALQQIVWPWLEEGKVKPLIFKTFPLAEASEAHRLMESSQHIGKIVLYPIGSSA